MGRYDKIRVYHDGAWKIPTQIKAYYNGAWYDLGKSDSYSTKAINVLNNDNWYEVGRSAKDSTRDINNNFVRATLNRKDTTIVTDRWCQYQFSLTPSNGYQHCCSANVAGNHYWQFLAMSIRHTSATESNIYFSGTRGWESYIRIRWTADGYIIVSSRFNNGVVNESKSKYAVDLNTDIKLLVYQYASSSALQIYVNDQNWTPSSNNRGGYSHFYGNAYNAVGDANIQFRGNIELYGTAANGGATYAIFDATYASGTQGYYVGAQHFESSYVETTYE